MSSALTILLGLQAAAVPVPPSITAAGLTRPNEDIACTVVGGDGQARRVAFRVKGSQGYPTGKLPAFAATEARFEVVEDQTGFFARADALYDNISADHFSGQWRDKKLGRFSSDGKSLALIQFFPSSGGASTVVMERQTQPMMSAMPDFAFAGGCKSTATPQKPLAAAPIAKDIRQ